MKHKPKIEDNISHPIAHEIRNDDDDRQSENLDESEEGRQSVLRDSLRFTRVLNCANDGARSCTVECVGADEVLFLLWLVSTISKNPILRRRKITFSCEFVTLRISCKNSLRIAILKQPR